MDDQQEDATSEPCDAIREVRVTHWPNGVLFPEGQSTDFSAFHSGMKEFRHVCRDGRVARSVYRMWDPYSAYGSHPLPAGQPRAGRAINNVIWVPAKPVLDRMLSALEEIAKECSVLWWDSAIQCFPYVARNLKRLFRLCILNFGDDLPGSSDVKTFPVASNFDVLAHAMYVWDPTSGRTVPDIYAMHGIRDCRFLAWGPLHGGVFTDEWFARKMARLRVGSLPVRLAWLGSSGMGIGRSRVLAAAAALSGIGKPVVRLHGNGMPGGWWAGSPPVLYAESVFGLNVAESSLFNGRFADLCMSGTVQVAYDPYRELPRFGFQDGIHYVAYDGSGADLYAKITRSVDHEALARIAEAARTRFVEYRKEHDADEVRAGILLDYDQQIREGRS